MSKNAPRTPASSPTDELENESSKIGIFPETKVEILIIGAGMAGLSAANHLLQNGCSNFRILEARNRIGGRICSIPLKSQNVELGANWIHGILGNPIYEIAVQSGLTSVVNVPKKHKLVAITEDGQQVPFDILQEVHEAYLCFLRRCDQYAEQEFTPPPEINSVGQHIQLEIDIYLSYVEDPITEHLKSLIFNCLLKRETCITGCHTMHDIDLVELGSYTELQGGNIVIPSGYSSILKPLTAQIPKDVILTNCPVKQIRWKRKRTLTGLDTLDEGSENEDSDESQSTVKEVPIAAIKSTSNDLRCASIDSNASCDFDDSTEGAAVRVICEDGRIFYADHVICTLPLGVLKEKYKTLFNPQLPHYKQEAIELLMFGTVDKIFLEYDRPIFNAEISEVMLLWEENKTKRKIDEKEDISEEYLSKNWFKKIYSFTKLSDTLLLGWISGREAEYMETLTHELVAQKCTDVLRKFLQDPYIPKPKCCVFTSWKSQPYSRGSYTCIPVGSLQEHLDHIADPLYAYPHDQKPTVTFAGEHTHYTFYSTVHGAYLSGRTAAQKLIDVEEAHEITMESDSSDLSAWIQGIALD